MEDHITLILHHGGVLVRNENRRLQYVGGEFCVWEKIYVDELCLWDIEKMVKHCKSYFKVSKLGYMKPYEGVTNDLNICLTPLTTDQHVLDMVQAARSNGNEVEIYAQHLVDSDEVEIVPLTTEEREELEREMEESLRSAKTTEEEPIKVMEVDILTAEERIVVECLFASVQNRVGNEEEFVDDMQEENVGAGNVVAHAGQSVAPRRYGLRGPVPSADRPKNTPMRGPAPAHPTPAGMIKVPYPTYGPPGSTQPIKFMEFIPTPGFQRSDAS